MNLLYVCLSVAEEEEEDSNDEEALGGLFKSVDQRRVRKYEQMRWTALAFTQTAAMTGIRRR